MCLVSTSLPTAPPLSLGTALAWPTHTEPLTAAWQAMRSGTTGERSPRHDGIGHCDCIIRASQEATASHADVTHEGGATRTF